MARKRLPRPRSRSVNRSLKERPMPTLEALAFDMYGTLVDPIGIRNQLERYLSDETPRVAEVWRQKQLGYTFLLTLMERYEDFERVTRALHKKSGLDAR